MARRLVKFVEVRMAATSRKRAGWRQEVPVYAEANGLVLHHAFDATDSPALRGDRFSVSAIPFGWAVATFRSWRDADSALRALAKVTDWSKVLSAKAGMALSASVLPILKRYRAVGR